MPFKWNPQHAQALQEMLSVLDDQIPEPVQDNHLTLTLEMDGKIVWSARAPDELTFTQQAAHALMALMIAGQTQDVREFLDTLISHTRADEGVEVVFMALAHMSEVMDQFLTNIEAMSRTIPGAPHFARPHFQVENWPPPDHPPIKADPDTPTHTEEPDVPTERTPDPEPGTGSEPA